MNIQRRLAVGIVIMALLPAGCIPIEGGAVEAGWDLRFPDGRRVDDGLCSSRGLAGLRIALEPVAPDTYAPTGGVDPCQGAGHCQFECAPFGSGTTDFAIPEGTYAIALTVLDTTGKSLGPGDGVVTPAPVVRQIRTGEVTDLNVNLIIVDR